MLKGGVKGISERNRIYMKQWKKYLNEIFIDGLSGMASGLFATLIIGTIILGLNGIAVMYFLLHGIMAFGISEFIRKKGLICEGSMKLSV